MKKGFLLVFTFSFLLSHAQAGMYTLEKVKHIKASKLLVGTTGEKEIDDSLMAAVTEFWTFTDVEGQISVEEGTLKTKDDKNFVLLKFKKIVPSFMTRNNNELQLFECSSNSWELVICSGEESLFECPVPSSINTFPKENLYYGISSMNDALFLVLENELEKNSQLMKKTTERAPELKNKKLLILDRWLDGNLTEEDVKSFYGAPVAVVSYNEWREAILNRTPNTAYVMINPIIAGGEYFYTHAIMDAEKGISYGIANYQKRVDIIKNSLWANTSSIGEAMLKKYAKLHK